MPASFSSGRERSSIVSSGGTFWMRIHLPSGDSVVSGGGGASTMSAISFGGILYWAKRGRATSRRIGRTSRFFMVREDNAVMPTLTIRNVPAKTVRALKALAKRNGLKKKVDRSAVLAKIEASWANQTRPTTAEEVDAWIRESR